MRDLRYRTIQLAFKISVLSREDGMCRKGTIVTWESTRISCNAGQAAVQSNNQCQWEDQVNSIEQEKEGLHR